VKPDSRSRLEGAYETGSQIDGQEGRATCLIFVAGLDRVGVVLLVLWELMTLSVWIAEHNGRFDRLGGFSDADVGPPSRDALGEPAPPGRNFFDQFDEPRSPKPAQAGPRLVPVEGNLFAAQEARQRNPIGTYVLMAILPPFLVWVCWHVLIWIARGFVSERAR